MQVYFHKLRDDVYSIKLELPYTNAEIVNELKVENWEEDIAGYGQNSFPTRFRIRQVQSNILREIEQYVEHGKFKHHIIDQLYQYPGFAAMWGVDPAKMDQQTFIYGVFTKDLPGYFIRPHTDDRMHVVQGMIYFIPIDDPDQSTTFYTTFGGDNPMRIPTGPGAGYVAANTNNGWHAGKNASTQDRYSLIFGIRLNL